MERLRGRPRDRRRLGGSVTRREAFMASQWAAHELGEYGRLLVVRNVESGRVRGAMFREMGTSSTRGTLLPARAFAAKVRLPHEMYGTPDGRTHRQRGPGPSVRRP